MPKKTQLLETLISQCQAKYNTITSTYDQKIKLERNKAQKSLLILEKTKKLRNLNSIIHKAKTKLWQYKKLHISKHPKIIKTKKRKIQKTKPQITQKTTRKDLIKAQLQVKNTIRKLKGTLGIINWLPKFMINWFVKDQAKLRNLNRLKTLENKAKELETQQQNLIPKKSMNEKINSAYNLSLRISSDLKYQAGQKRLRDIKRKIRKTIKELPPNTQTEQSEISQKEIDEFLENAKIETTLKKVNALPNPPTTPIIEQSKKSKHK